MASTNCENSHQFLKWQISIYLDLTVKRRFCICAKCSRCSSCIVANVPLMINYFTITKNEDNNFFETNNRKESRFISQS